MHVIARRLSVTTLVLLALLAQPLEPLVAANAREAASQAAESAAAGLLAPLSSFEERKIQVIRYVACTAGFEATYQGYLGADEPETGENLIYQIVAKIALVNSGTGCTPDIPNIPTGCNGGLTRACLTEQINALLSKLKADARVGTAGIPCAPFFGVFKENKADYDVVLRGLIWILYNFPPPTRPTGFGLRPEVYKHVRDQMLTIQGVARHPPRAQDYRYGVLSCGNAEKETGTPTEHVENYQALEAVCKTMNVDCRAPIQTSSETEEEGCQSSVLNFIACLAGLVTVMAVCTLVPAICLAAAALAVGADTAAALVVLGFILNGLAPGAGWAIAGALAGGVIWADEVVTIPESENHILMIESSRYLTNKLKQRDYECVDVRVKDIVCSRDDYRGASTLYDNSANRMAEWLLIFQQRLLKEDFIEYNARPYQRYSTIALLNLYDMACQITCTDDDTRVKIAARAILDYLSAKFAVSSSSLRRFVPFRRKAGVKSIPPNEAFEDFFKIGSDYHSFRFQMYVGQPGRAPCLVPDRVPPLVLCADLFENGWIELLTAGLSAYRVPDLLLPLLEATSYEANAEGLRQTQCAGYLQRFHHQTPEVYYCAPNFVISGGGVKTKAAYFSAGDFKADDVGVALPTLFMPNGSTRLWADFIRFEGGVDNSPNLCVDRNFACGVNLLIPSSYTGSPGCVTPEGNWTFIDGKQCGPGVRGHYYVAIYAAPCTTETCAATGAHDFGFLEAVGSQNIDFEGFKRAALRQEDRGYRPDGENTFTRYSAGEVRFVPLQASVFYRESADWTKWPFAEGDLVRSSGDGCIWLMRRDSAEVLILSMTDYLNPRIRRMVQPRFRGGAVSCANLGTLHESEQ